MMESVESSFYVFKDVIDKRLPQPPRTIIEVGARNCSETLAFHECYHDAKIYSFECNPTTLPLCRAAVQGIPQIELIEKAVCLTNDKVTFYPIDKDKTVTTHEDDNPGASSLFKASGKYPHEKYASVASAYWRKSFFCLKNSSIGLKMSENHSETITAHVF
jgi:hypothetical protein